MQLSHYINQGIRENKKLSVNVIDESWLKDADRMGTISGNKMDKSEAFAWTMGENGAPLIDEAKVSIECEVDGNYESEYLVDKVITPWFFSIDYAKRKTFD